MSKIDVVHFRLFYCVKLFIPPNLKYNYRNYCNRRKTVLGMFNRYLHTWTPILNCRYFAGARIDHAHHDGLANIALDETIELEAAVREAVRLTDEADTLIITTADHSHVFTMGGYPKRGNDILGIWNDELVSSHNWYFIWQCGGSL